MPKAKPRPQPTTSRTARKRLRKLLHDQLDSLLNGTTTENGVTVSVLDDMTSRALVGYGFNLRIHSLHPDQTTTVKEAPATVEAGPAMHLVDDKEKSP